MQIPQRKLGKTGVNVTILGLGGEGILRTVGHEREAKELISRALALGINYFESARAYSGSESYYGAALGKKRKEIFLTSKSHARDKQGTTAHLQQTLSNMKTDYLDLWQVHDVRTDEEIEEIFGPGGAIEAFVEAKRKGLTRYIGVTGHHDPVVLRKCIELVDFDTVLLPANPAEPSYKSFLEHVVPFAIKKEMGIIGMKVYLRGLAARLPGVDTLEPFFHFALSQQITTAVIGCDTVPQLEENVRFAARFAPLSPDTMSALIQQVDPFAREIMYYKP